MQIRWNYGKSKYTECARDRLSVWWSTNNVSIRSVIRDVRFSRQVFRIDQSTDQRYIGVQPRYPKWSHRSPRFLSFSASRLTRTYIAIWSWQFSLQRGLNCRGLVKVHIVHWWRFCRAAQKSFSFATKMTERRERSRNGKVRFADNFPWLIVSSRNEIMLADIKWDKLFRFYERFLTFLTRWYTHRYKIFKSYRGSIKVK